MDEKTRQLVQSITEQVIATLLQQGGQSSAAPSRTTKHPGPAVIRAPVGVCTGDYSKFPELAGRQVGASPPAGTLSGGAAPSPIPLSGIVTASQLQTAMHAASDGVAALTSDARLTPLANDLARQYPEKICRITASPPGTGGPANGGSNSDLPWLWWIDGACPAVQELVSARAGGLRGSGAASHPAALAQVVRDLSAAVKRSNVAGGLLFVQNAARAMCFANRCPSIRAVVGTCGEAVEQGIAELGANVLVIEFPHQGPKAMEAMMDRMMQQPPTPLPAVQRELEDLHRCG